MAHPRRNFSAFSASDEGFTLIELSIVLVIIGLIIGGVLVGQDLISAAQTRAQVTQIEKYNSAVNTFVTKYGYIPGDMPDPYASQFGFGARGSYTGEGDGNGLIEGVWTNAASSNWSGYQSTGETAVFWVDLSTSGLIGNKLSTATETTTQPGISGTVLGNFFPTASIGNGNYVYVWGNFGTTAGLRSKNWFTVAAITNIGTACTGCIQAVPAFTVAQAYNIDKKIDDGYPQSGAVMALVLTHNASSSLPWASGLDTAAIPYTTSTPGSATTCFDNGSGSGPQQYSMEISNGSNPNCALSFVMQGAAR